MRYSFRKIRPNKYAVFENGEVIDVASGKGRAVYALTGNVPHIDIGTVEISLALAAVSALLSSSDLGPRVQAFAGLAFFHSLVAAYALVIAYGISRSPLVLEEIYDAAHDKVWAVAALCLLAWPFHLLKLLFKLSLDPEHEVFANFEIMAEVAYFMIMVASTLVALASGSFMAAYLPQALGN